MTPTRSSPATARRRRPWRGGDERRGRPAGEEQRCEQAPVAAVRGCDWFPLPARTPTPRRCGFGCVVHADMGRCYRRPAADPGREPRLQAPVKILYIVGFPRSGSTLLDRLVAANAGLLSAGEVRRVWERGLLADELCGCGQPFSACPFWTRVDRAGVRRSRRGRCAGDGLRDRSARGPPRPAGARWRAASWERGAAPSATPTCSGSTVRCSSVSGAPAIVDSSKDSTYALLLSKIEGLEVEFVHLVRDSRAVAFSWQRRRRRPEIVDREEYMPVIRPAGTAAGWSARNLSAEALRGFSGRYVRLRYEDLAADPDAALGEVLGDLPRAERRQRFAAGARRPPPHGLGQPHAPRRRTARGQTRRRVDVGDERSRPHHGHGALIAAPAPLRLSPLPRPHASRLGLMAPAGSGGAGRAGAVRERLRGRLSDVRRAVPGSTLARTAAIVLAVQVATGVARYRSRSSSRAAAAQRISGCTPSPSAGPSCWSCRRRSA